MHLLRENLLQAWLGHSGWSLLRGAPENHTGRSGSAEEEKDGRASGSCTPYLQESCRTSTILVLVGGRRTQVGIIPFHASQSTYAVATLPADRVLDQT